MGFLELTASVLCVTDNVKFKITQRIISVMRREDAGCTVPALFCTVPRSSGSCLVKDHHPLGDPIDKHS